MRLDVRRGRARETRKRRGKYRKPISDKLLIESRDGAAAWVYIYILSARRGR